MPSFFEKLLGKWDKPRVYFWLSRLVGSVFGRRLACRACGKDLGKILPIIRDNKVALIGLQKHSVRYCGCGVSELEFECVDHPRSPLGSRRKPAKANPPAPTRVLHVFLAHQGPAYVQSYAEYHRRLLAKEDEMLLVFGGKEADFAANALLRKTFCPDSRLRGTGYFQSYTSVFTEAWKWCTEHGERWDYVLFTEADFWGLIPGYTKELPQLLQNTNAHFAAHGLVNIENSNNWFLANALKRGKFDEQLQRMAGFNRPEYWHCLGAGICMQWEAFEEFCTQKHNEEYCFLEIYLPSVLSSLGWNGVNINANSPAFDYVRYRPIFSTREFMEIRKSGAPFLHPYKPEGDSVPEILLHNPIAT